MLVIEQDEIRVMLPKHPLLNGFYKNIKQEYKGLLARVTSTGSYYVPVETPLTTPNVENLTKDYYETLDRRLLVNKVTNAFFSITPFLLFSLILKDITGYTLVMLLLVLFTISHMLYFKLNSSLLLWYKSQVVAAEQLKQYVYMSFNVACVNDIGQSVDIIKNQNKSIIDLDTSLKDTLEINRVLHTRYSDLANRTPKATLRNHLDFCKIKLPVPAEYEQQESQLKH